MLRNLVPYLLVFILCGCKAEPSQKEIPQKEIKVAFIADVHFADVYPNLEGSDYKGIYDSIHNRSTLLRTMNAQLHSTRLFNENYFAFFAALDDAVAKGIKTIALPGDFSDDGQPLHIKGLGKILDRYAEEHGISFFLINGNHDPTTPFGEEGGKSDFLGANGKAQPLMSEVGKYKADKKSQNPTQVVTDLKEWGYADMVQELKHHGFFPKRDYRFWSTPFSEYAYEDYGFEKAKKASGLKRRTYNLDVAEVALPDVSYLVEPVDGLWLLALDANVYLPKENSSGFSGAGIGYNEVLTHKKHLIRWTEKVVQEADRLGKTLIAFSHYPMVDFNDGASEDIKALFGKKAFQAHRIPSQLVGKTFANAGLKIHVGGHMHINDTGVITTAEGHTLVNIQSPSLAAYVPAYKIITVKNDQLEVETVVLDEVKGYDTFFGTYEKEYAFLASDIANDLWEKKILSSTSYLAYTQMHLQELIRLRFIPTDWPEELTQQLLNRRGWELLTVLERDENLVTQLQEVGLTKQDFIGWEGADLIVDFYKFKNGDELAKRDIDAVRLKAYQFLLKKWSENEGKSSLKQFAAIFKKQMQGEPSVQFSIDLGTGKLMK
ncbi:metallophosphoesterase [Zobellia galactanivorans]|uniref:metallophosphoesterase family protein n=1 Tax=Zobellia galactanivorans (strain DSM 12802 / CCUG 47099 / CIP 106680 / NCIMB 13871 / Dsij) TaxID=63186 RepID=UPI0026E35822|nr:metallophosphoesterase [Zobellia galactanivorans]MDO6809898.1 metallophosphoesterase [Zobellia galactanivorans]